MACDSCPETCGDGTCDEGEEGVCIADCGGPGPSVCVVDGECTGEETSGNCPEDCPLPCFDDPGWEDMYGYGCTDYAENPGWCGEDDSLEMCPVSCGICEGPSCNNDGDCGPGESPDNCPEDCTVVCSDNPDWFDLFGATCADYAIHQQWCGDYESLEMCPIACGVCEGPSCNDDGHCDPGESPDSCPEDCGGADADADGVADAEDNCPQNANPDQEDQDGKKL